MVIPVNELRAGTVFQDPTGVWQVESFEHIKMGRGSATIKVKAKNLRSGAISEKSFISGNKVEDADATKVKAQYLYHDDSNIHLMNPVSFDQSEISLDKAPNLPKFIKEGSEIEVLMVEGEPVVVEMPKNVILSVAEADPGERGNSVSNLMKSAVLETGAAVQVPLFVKAGDRIKVDTRSGEYLERA